MEFKGNPQTSINPGDTDKVITRVVAISFTAASLSAGQGTITVHGHAITRTGTPPARGTVYLELNPGGQKSAMVSFHNPGASAEITIAVHGEFRVTAGQNYTIDFKASNNPPSNHGSYNVNDSSFLITLA